MGMIALILAQRDPFGVGDWFEIIVLVLIFGGSIFAAVAKKLIARFSPKETDKTTVEPLEDHDVAPASCPPARPGYPVARPMPPPPGSQPPSAPPMAQPFPRPPGARPAQMPPVPQRPRPPAWVEASAGRAARPVAVGRPAAPRPAPEEEWERTGEKSKPVRLAADVSQADPDIHLAEVVSVDAPTTTAGEKVATPAELIGTLSRENLRRAILMNEILGPPRALRDFDEPL